MRMANSAVQRGDLMHSARLRVDGTCFSAHTLLVEEVLEGDPVSAGDLRGKQFRNADNSFATRSANKCCDKRDDRNDHPDVRMQAGDLHGKQFRNAFGEGVLRQT